MSGWSKTLDSANLWSSTIRSMITKCMIFKIKQKISSVFIRQHFLKLEFFDEVPPQIREKVNNDSTNDFLILLFSQNDSYLQSVDVISPKIPISNRKYSKLIQKKIESFWQKLHKKDHTCKLCWWLYGWLYGWLFVWFATRSFFNIFYFWRYFWPKWPYKRKNKAVWPQKIAGFYGYGFYSVYALVTKIIMIFKNHIFESI